MLHRWNKEVLLDSLIGATSAFTQWRAGRADEEWAASVSNVWSRGWALAGSHKRFDISCYTTSDVWNRGWVDTWAPRPSKTIRSPSSLFPIPSSLPRFGSSSRPPAAFQRSPPPRVFTTAAFQDALYCKICKLRSPHRRPPVAGPSPPPRRRPSSPLPSCP